MLFNLVILIVTTTLCRFTNRHLEAQKVGYGKEHSNIKLEAISRQSK